MRYSVGDVVTHKLFGTAVIVGWDVRCEAADRWIAANGIARVLKNGVDQPFYHLLLDDGTARYCSQENVKVPRRRNVNSGNSGNGGNGDNSNGNGGGGSCDGSSSGRSIDSSNDGGIGGDDGDGDGDGDGNGGGDVGLKGTHSDLGFYFDRFDAETSSYAPNKYLTHHYPHDVEARNARNARNAQGRWGGAGGVVKSATGAAVGMDGEAGGGAFVSFDSAEGSVAGSVEGGARRGDYDGEVLVGDNRTGVPGRDRGDGEDVEEWDDDGGDDGEKSVVDELAEADESRLAELLASDDRIIR